MISVSHITKLVRVADSAVFPIQNSLGNTGNRTVLPYCPITDTFLSQLIKPKKTLTDCYFLRNIYTYCFI